MPLTERFKRKAKQVLSDLADQVSDAFDVRAKSLQPIPVKAKSRPGQQRR